MPNAESKNEAIPRSDDDVEVIVDLVYAIEGGVSLLADIYLPRTSETIRPVVIYLHGGGWKIGDRRLAPDLRRYFASRGFAMVSIDYRLSGQAIFPAAVEDVKNAIRWVKDRAGHYGLDADRVGLWGSSAGGHLASLSTTSGPGFFERDAPGLPSSVVQAVVDGYGPTDFLQEDAHRDPSIQASDDPESLRLPQGKRSADTDSLEAAFLGTPILEDRVRVATANPITYAKPGLPPFLIMHGLSDVMVPSNQSELLFEALAPNRIDVTLMLVEGLGHGFFNRNDLDDQGPRTVRVSRAASGEVMPTRVEQHLIFEAVARFFERHLTAP